MAGRPARLTALKATLAGGLVVVAIALLHARLGRAQQPPDVPASCSADLAATGAKFSPWPGRGSRGCEVVQGVSLARGPAGLEFARGAHVNCAFAQRLVQFERVVDEEARKSFGAPVKRIEHLGTYACRHMAAYPDLVSEHSYANAIDVAAFILPKGRRVEIERDWVPATKATERPESLFLRHLVRRLYDEKVFSVVLTPSYDKHHKNHLHLDGAPYTVDGT